MSIPPLVEEKGWQIQQIHMGKLIQILAVLHLHVTADNNGFSVAQYFQRDLQKISNKKGLTYTMP
jgi:hypothetical protein